MPTYEYECQACRQVFEIRQRISEAPLTTCGRCGGQVRRLLSPAAFILKGEGWYVTDYPSEARKKAKKNETPTTSTSTSPTPPSSEKKSSTEPTASSSSSPGGTGSAS